MDRLSGGDRRVQLVDDVGELSPGVECEVPRPRARLERRGIAFPGVGPEVKLRKQMVRCGKENCTRCPHGPYWYAYWNEDGKRRSRYIGKLEDVP